MPAKVGLGNQSGQRPHGQSSRKRSCPWLHGSDSLAHVPRSSSRQRLCLYASMRIYCLVLALQRLSISLPTHHMAATQIHQCLGRKFEPACLDSEAAQNSSTSINFNSLKLCQLTRCACAWRGNLDSKSVKYLVHALRVQGAFPTI